MRGPVEVRGTVEGRGTVEEKGRAGRGAQLAHSMQAHVALCETRALHLHTSV